ncbi:MAG: hypothetical protein WBP26_05990 [Candidatus Saccharimonadales bacterium]
MSVQRWNFESGNNGDTVNATNGGADSIQNTGGTATISTAQAAHGTRSALFTATATSGTLYLSKAVTATTNLGLDAYIYVTATPDAEATLLWLGAGSTRQVSLAMTTSRQIRIRDAGGAGGTSLWVSTATIPLNTWVRISIVASQSSTTGTVRAAFYTGDSTTATEDSTLLTGRNTGANPYSNVRVGLKTSTGTVQCTAYLDDWAYDIEAVALLPPYGATPPTLGTPSVSYDMAYIDMSGTTFTIGPGIFSATPSSGTHAASGGVIVPRDPDGDTITYVITATDSNTGASANVNVNVDGVTPFIRGQSESVVWNGTDWI